MKTRQDILTAFPSASKYIEVHGANMHYIDEGSGDPLLFLHGNPPSSYLWRNIPPYLVPHGRCLAPELIGMGKSDKPDLDYRFVDHVKYLEGFIKQLALSNITLVLHDWGSALGFHYAMGHEDNIKGLAFMESLVKPLIWADFPSDFKIGFKLMRTPGIAWFMLSVMNVFITQILPQATVRDLSPEEKRHYATPYKTIRSRKPIRQWPREIPIEGKPVDVHAMMSSYSQKLQKSELPKLLFYATPGGLIDARTVEWCMQHLKNIKTVDIGEGIHYVQEDNPHVIGEELATWFQDI